MNKWMLIILFISFSGFAATSSMNNRTVYGYFVDNTHKDRLTCDDGIKNNQTQYDYTCTFFLKNQTLSWVIYDNNHCSTFAIKQSENAGEILVECGSWGEFTQLFYRYDKKLRNWFLFKHIFERYAMGGPDDDSGYTEIISPENRWSLDKKLLKIKDVKTVSQLVPIVEKKLQNKRWYDIKAIANVYVFNPSDLTVKTVSDYNTLAFYYEQATAYEPAKTILKEVIKQFPNRAVAYLNLGDVYLKEGNIDKARYYYEIYIKQLKAQNKEKNIPLRVYQSIENQNVNQLWDLDKKLLRIKDFETVPKLVSTVAQKFKNKQWHDIEGIANAYIFKSSNLTHETVVAYNNLAFYYEQAGIYKPAILILKAIIKCFPDRAVAYLNLGDVYLKQGYTYLAIDHYANYKIKLGKRRQENKIPQRVLNELNRNLDRKPE